LARNFLLARNISSCMYPRTTYHVVIVRGKWYQLKISFAYNADHECRVTENQCQLTFLLTSLAFDDISFAHTPDGAEYRRAIE
ncbi:hypothetical protein RvY_02103, partial [Ramazzottius varieornatus]